MSVGLFETEEGRDRLFASLVDLREHPEVHNQGAYFCTTGHCLAGDIILKAGAVPYFGDDTSPFPEVLGVQRDEDGVAVATSLCTYKGQRESIPELAAQLITLDPDEAEQLWIANNSIEALWSMAEALQDGQSISASRRYWEEYVGSEYDYDDGYEA